MKQKNPDPDSDRITWEHFFMAVAKLSAMKQGRHEKCPELTVR